MPTASNAIPTLIKALIGVVAAAALLSACSTPEERVAGFTRSGESLLQKEEVGKAGIEFRNALQINPDHLPALRGLLEVFRAQENDGQIFAVLNKIVDLDTEDAASRIDLGQRLLVRNNIERAKTLSDEAMALLPEDPAGLSLAAAVALKYEDPAGAVALAKRSIAGAPNRSEPYIVLSAERVLVKDFEAAIAALDRGITAVDDKAALQLIKIELLQQRIGDRDRIDAAYRALIDGSPDEPAYLRAYGVFLARNRDNRARDIFQRFVDASPDDNEAKKDYVRLIATLDGQDAARASLKKIVDENAGNFEMRRFYADFVAAQGDLDTAKAELLTIGDDAPEELDRLSALARVAEIEFRSGDKEKAKEISTDILDKDATQSEALVVRAALALDNSDTLSAIADLRTVLLNESDYLPALLLIARAHEIAGSMELAEERFGQAFQVSGNRSGPGIQFTQFLLRQNKVDRAVEVMKAVAGREPNNTTVLENLAALQLRVNDFVGAQETTQQLRSVTENPERADFISGFALQGLNQFNESVEAFRKSYETGDQGDNPLLALVRAYQSAGRSDEAIDYLK
ncbi:MAG: tetratricopeptide repeat protein, partial [Pseudomonadota bacterium]